MYVSWFFIIFASTIRKLTKSTKKCENNLLFPKNHFDCIYSLR